MNYAEGYATLGDRIAHSRETRGLSQADLALRLGVKKSTIKKWENDRAEPRSNRLYMLAGVINVSVMWLLTGEGNDPSISTDLGTMDKDVVRATIMQLRENMKDMERTIQALEASL